MLDSVYTKELTWREPAKRSHREMIASTLVGSELPTKVVQRKEEMGIVETLLILAVATFHLAVVPWSVGSDEFVSYPIGC